MKCRCVAAIMALLNQESPSSWPSERTSVMPEDCVSEYKVHAMCVNCGNEHIAPLENRYAMVK